MTWEDNPVDAEQPAWNAGLPSTANDAALAAEMQVQELGNNFAGMGLDGSKGLRRTREYGTLI